MNWDSFLLGVCIGWVAAIAIVFLLLQIKIKEYDDDE